mgnify:CR=1 FL=1|tara:strand:+ start:360 stop:842 length:483 start_codon:yes stop_codon:yes gene_type:complete
MAKMYGASEVAGPGKGKNRPNTKAKVAARQTARKASGMSAQKSYVKTRMAEAAKSGKTLDKAALRKKFQSGDVARKGFGAPKKKDAGYTNNTGKPLTAEQIAKRKTYRIASDKNEADLKTLMSNTPMGTYSKGKAFADAEKSSEGKRRVAMYGRTRQGSK